MPTFVQSRRQGAVIHLSLSRPDKRNALSPELCRELLDALARADKESPRALLLTGAGPVFCAGGDIGAMHARLAQPRATLETIRSVLNPVIRALATFPAPTVAAVQGAAVGAGLGVALACDVVVAAEDAKLGAVQTRLGLTPDGGASFFLARLVGPKRAMAMVLGADMLTGEEAARIGLVTKAVPSEELEATAREYAQTLARGPTRAYVLARELVMRGLGGSLDDALEREAHSQALAYATADQQEGVRAFVEKRAPKFAGR